MFDKKNINSRVLNPVMDFVVLGVTFFLSSLYFSVASGSAWLLQILVYSTTLLVCVRLSKRAIVSYNRPIGEASRQILGNGTGILIGTCIMLVLVKLVSAGDQIFVVVMFSSVMAFFIMGTLSPIVFKLPISHKNLPNF